MIRPTYFDKNTLCLACTCHRVKKELCGGRGRRVLGGLLDPALQLIAAGDNAASAARIVHLRCRHVDETVAYERAVLGVDFTDIPSDGSFQNGQRCVCPKRGSFLDGLCQQIRVLLGELVHQGLLERNLWRLNGVKDVLEVGLDIAELLRICDL